MSCSTFLTLLYLIVALLPLHTLIEKVMKFLIEKKQNDTPSILLLISIYTPW